MSILSKQIFKSIMKNKTNLIILFLLIMLTSFMFFFVQFSIDSNMNMLNEKLKTRMELSNNEQNFLTALQSNTILARSFLYVLLVITAFIFYMFYKKYFALNKREIGCYKSLGFTNTHICFKFILFTVSLTTISSLIGVVLGYYASDILNSAYVESFEIVNVQKGITFSSFLMGVGLVIVVLSFVAFFTCYQCCKQDAAILISGADSRLNNSKAIKFGDYLAKFAPKKYRFSLRIALRKPVTLLLTIIAVGIVMVMFIISGSLNLSSKKIYASQTEGHNYQYHIKHETFQKKVTDGEGIYYLQAAIQIENKDGDIIKQQLVGLQSTSSLLELENNRKEPLEIPSQNRILINPALEDLYGFKKGDTITFSVGDQKRTGIITDIAENAQSNSIYMSKEQLAKWLGISANMYSGVLSNERMDTKEATVITKEQRVEELEKAAVSNRISGVINQVLGCVIGVLLIYLVLLLNFQDNAKDILILNMLGYNHNQINRMIINIYWPILNGAFILMLLPSIWISKLIQRELSIQTGDYMPFQTGIFFILLVFIVINVIYSIVQVVFNIKIKKVVNQEQITDYLT